MAGVTVGVGIHRHGADAHLAGGLDDTASDFAAVGDQDFGEHETLPSFSIRLGFVIARACMSPLGTRRTRLRECPPPAARAPPLFRSDGYTVPQAAKGVLSSTAAYPTTRIGLPGRFAQVKEEAEGRGTRSKTSGQPKPAKRQAISRPMAFTAECSRACATGFPASCHATSPASGRCVCGFHAAGSHRR